MNSIFLENLIEWKLKVRKVLAEILVETDTFNSVCSEKIHLIKKYDIQNDLYESIGIQIEKEEKRLKEHSNGESN